MNNPDNSISLVSLNIEGDKHLDAVIGFLQKNNPEVVCLQEVFEKDFPAIKKQLGMAGYFSPMTIEKTSDSKNNLTACGVAILTSLRVEEMPPPLYYFGKSDSIPFAVKGDPNTVNKVVLSIVLTKNNNRFTFGTTHFTLSDEGKADENQRKDLEEMLKLLSDFEDIILGGDFNAPRGGEIFSKISLKYKDNIPMEYETSIDGNLHRAKGLKLMVDGLFSTPHYQIKNVRLIDGVSDHCAIIAEVSRFSYNYKK